MATGLPLAGAWCMREQRKEEKNPAISTFALSSSFGQSASPEEGLIC